MSMPVQTLYTTGLLLADRTNGPFRLEIKHIKAVRRINNKQYILIFGQCLIKSLSYMIIIIT